jgi:hypothetical protein
MDSGAAASNAIANMTRRFANAPTANATCFVTSTDKHSNRGSGNMSTENQNKITAATEGCAAAAGYVCRRCNVPMTQGMAIPPATQCSDEGTCSYAMWSTKAPLVPVWKCPKCGHSITTHTKDYPEHISR